MNTPASSAKPNEDWRSDVWGTMNEVPADGITSRIALLDAAAEEPHFRNARKDLLRNLGIAPGSNILEAGCGPGVGLRDLLELTGSMGQITGLDPTVAFIATARERAQQASIPNVSYDVGDIRELPYADGTFDAAFTDKVLIHVGPTQAALSELVRVTRPGGRVGTLEHQRFHLVYTSSRPDLVALTNDAYTQSTYDPWVSMNLARHFAAAGLVDIQSRAYLAHIRNIDENLVWRRLVEGVVVPAVNAGKLSADDARAFMAEIAELSDKGEFDLCCIIMTAVGTKPT